MFDHKLIAGTIVAVVPISILKQEWTFLDTCITRSTIEDSEHRRLIL